MTDTRSSSALFKRAEQLKRWEESETNKQSAFPKKPSKINFSSGCVFLAACTAGDKDEVLRLLKLGADIDTANVDGLTALHQACIDDNLDMVEFLVSRGADVNRGDNEGWTPLHATASCGFISIARFLLESGADVAAVNYDGELAIDIAESDEMDNMLRKVIIDKGVDCDMAREAEERIMCQHVQKWMVTESSKAEEKHPKTGATPLHVAAAKGYINVLNCLLSKCAVEVDPIDLDGWTPLHAAALWGQKEAVSILIQHGADLDMKNYAGQTCFDLVDDDMAHTLEELRKTFVSNNNSNNVNNRHKRGPPPRADPPNSKLKKVEVQITNRPPIIQDPVANEKKNNRNNSNEQLSTKPPITSPTQPTPIISDGKPPKVRAPSPEVTSEENTTRNNTEEAPSWRRPASFRSRLQSDNPRDNKTSPTNPPPPENDTILRRTHSFENDKTFYQRYRDVTARIKASSCPILPPIPPQHISPADRDHSPNKQSQTDDHLLSLENFNEQIVYRKDQPDPNDKENAWTSPSNQKIRSKNVPSTTSTETVTSNSAPNTPVAPTTTPTKLSPGNIFKNFFKSFVPPVRDEESETQRKAHAKRVRETRRSTQGVTLDEIKSAEQYVKKKSNNCATTTTSEQLITSSPVCTKRAIAATSTVINSISLLMSPSIGSETSESGENKASHPSEHKDKREASTDTVAVTLPLNNTGISATATIATAGPERRPSWRLRVDPGCKFELEEVSKSNDRAPSPRLGSSAATDATVTLPLRRPSTASSNTNTTIDTATPDDEKEPSPDSRTSAQGSNVIQRRRRPKRRSTGVGVVDMDDIFNDRAGSTDGEEQDAEKTDTGEASEKRVSRDQVENAAPSENGNLDYKALWEASQVEVKRLRDIVKINEQQLRDARSTIERVTHVNQNSLTELEKREKRAMERKLSEMEEELKLQQAENQKLKDENGALIRVISKLSK